MNKHKKASIIIPAIFVVIFGTILLSYRASIKNKSMIPYKSFISEVEKGNVSEVYISNGETLKVRSKNGITFYTENPRSQTFKERLLLKGVRVHEGGTLSPVEVIPVSIFFVLMFSSIVYFTVKGSKGQSRAFKLSSIEAEPVKDTGISFNNIAGNDEAKESMKELVDFIKNPEKYAKYNARMPRGVILYGPPGTGKTLLAKALAREAGVPYFAVNGSDFVQIYVGVGAGRIRDLFKKAREKGKAVIFIDEIDAIGKKRSARAEGGSDEKDQTLNALLSEMSGFKDREGIVVVAATNRLDVLDDALLRPGRFDRHIEVGLPDINARYKILKLHGRNKPLGENVDLKRLAQMTVYFSGAMLENLMNEAAILAARENSEYITMEHLNKAYSTVLAGAEKKDRSFINDRDKLITAYHEAGHALVTKLVSPENKVEKVTIIPSTKGAGGYTLNIPPDRIYHTRTQLLNNIKIALGGRAAEEIIFGKDEITTGASGDIQNVTNTVLAMIKQYGMFKDTGLLNYDILESQGTVSSGEILKVCSSTVNELYEEVINLLSTNKDKLNKLALKLLEKETIYSDEIDSLVA
ncbi:ATP-dependent metallopeptidase FtsH/Yme1/Tma family protein [Fonticella tunisiensis]|uniref:ATP-dependent zinc metalloprotease FtsH n=1 Tax=Fonticella tunisiensis TaxID=1096341 RepID=A0A4R7KSU3_9CLOT|nr:FtsH/Yme1/Tma family ATP-dependent metallopeptidase [Fonticella tunisiensis]TDT61172.1 membrane protease FtsH catalytic subunit [Fonticella tunisiensis]